MVLKVGPFGIGTDDEYWPVFTEYEITNDNILRPTPTAIVKRYYSPLAISEITSKHFEVFDFGRKTIPEKWRNVLNLYSAKIFADMYNIEINTIREDAITGDLEELIRSTEYKTMIMTWVCEFGLPFVTNPIKDQWHPLEPHYDYSEGCDTGHQNWTKEEISNNHLKGIRLDVLIEQQVGLNTFIKLLSLTKRYIENEVKPLDQHDLALELRALLGRYYGLELDSKDLQEWYNGPNINEETQKLLRERYYSPSGLKPPDNLWPWNPRGSKSIDEICFEFVKEWLTIHANMYTRCISLGFRFDFDKSIVWNQVPPLNAFYFHLLTAKGAPIRCANKYCSNIFLPSRDDQKYCSVDCQRKTKNRATKARNALREKAISLLGEGRSLQDIALEICVDIEIIKGWIEKNN